MKRNISVSLKVTILYFILTAAAFLSASLVLYGYFERRLYDDLDTSLDARADGVIGSIKTYWETEESDYSGSRVSEGRIRRIEAEGFARIAKTWANDRGETPAFMAVAVQIFDAAGHPIATSPRLESGIGLSKETWEEAIAGKQKTETVEMGGPATRRAYRALALPVYYRGEPVYIVQVVASLQRTESALTNLRILLLTLFPIAVVIAGTIAFYIARTTLGPVQRMIDQIHESTGRDLRVPEDLKLRIAVPVTGRELTELAESFNAMMERSEQAFGTQARFFNDVSHQLKTPLSVLKGELETTLRRVRSRDEYERVLGSNLEEVDRMIRLVNRMLALARFDSGQVALRLEACDLGALVRSVADDFAIMAGSREVALAVTGPASLTIAGDREKLYQALAAILENAVRHAPPRSAIDIAIEAGGEAATVRVRDRGSGIQEGEREKIFERFYRGANEGGSGFGVGLSMARSIVRLHSGELVAQNAPDGGAVFILTVPTGRDTST